MARGSMWRPFFQLLSLALCVLLTFVAVTSRWSSSPAPRPLALVWHNRTDQWPSVDRSSKIVCRESMFCDCGSPNGDYEVHISQRRFTDAFKLHLDPRGPLPRGLSVHLDPRGPLPRGLSVSKTNATVAAKVPLQDDTDASAKTKDGGSDLDKTKKIFRISYYNMPSWKRPFVFEGCPFSNCESAGSSTDESVDLVVVQGELLNVDAPLPQRWPHQIYAMCGWESPNYFYGSKLLSKVTPWNSVFNLTMTYRQDADMFLPYRTLRYTGPAHLLNITQVFLKKTKTALALISNCEKGSGRLAYIKELQKHIDVDVFGRCGTPCPPQSGLCDRSHYLEVEDRALEPYMFYLAFENSFCEDYLSEKFFKAYDNHRPMVTVARGGADYNRFFPPDTFINAADFKTAADLGRYLRKLTEHPELYFEILRRKMMYTVVGMRSQACLMCEFLNKRDPALVRTYHDIREWVGQCRAPPDDLG